MKNTTKSVPAGRNQGKSRPDSHEKFVRQAHEQAKKPASPSGNTFKYPIRMGE